MEQLFTLQQVLFYTLYGGVTLLCVVASCYLLLGRANVFVPHITPPVRLRRLAGIFCAIMALTHVWWMPFYYLQPVGNRYLGGIICSTLDFLTTMPLLILTMLAMLQDRRRPFWPYFMPILLLFAFFMVSIVGHINITAYIFPISIVLLLYIAVIMTVAVRQYGRWLHDNYADLEHKELGLSFVVLAAFMLMYLFYFSSYDYNIVIEFVIQLFDILLICALLWRVETLQTLTTPVADVQQEEQASNNTISDQNISRIATLLEKYCVNEEYYLNHDISISQMAEHIGTNSKYLSRYFSQQGITYNTYINGLRIQYFVNHYKEAVASKRDFTAHQLASESGFHSYSTFSAVFKQSMGTTVTKWMSFRNREKLFQK